MTSTRPPLDPRHRRILTFVVESHVSRAEPVGSQYVRAAYHLSISPATIRNAMQQLEELGLLGHPHTSAGRVPTEAGYRYYVDELMRPESIGTALRRSVDAAFRPGVPGDQALAEAAPKLLARVSRQLAIATMADRVRRVIERADLIALDDGDVLLAARDAGGRLSTSSWTPLAASTAETRRRAERRLREALPIASVEEARARARDARANPDPEGSLLAEALERIARLIPPSGGPDVRLDGADHIAAQPEFQSPDRLRPLVSLLADREPLARALEASAGAGRARVTIGSENGPGAMRHCSLVAMRIDWRGRQGLVGILGPVRMPYRKIVSLVSYVGERLSEYPR